MTIVVAGFERPEDLLAWPVTQPQGGVVTNGPGPSSDSRRVTPHEVFVIADSLFSSKARTDDSRIPVQETALKIWKVDLTVSTPTFTPYGTVTEGYQPHAHSSCGLVAHSWRFEVIPPLCHYNE